MLSLYLSECKQLQANEHHSCKSNFPTYLHKSYWLTQNQNFSIGFHSLPTSFPTHLHSICSETTHAFHHLSAFVHVHVWAITLFSYENTAKWFPNHSYCLEITPSLSPHSQSHYLHFSVSTLLPLLMIVSADSTHVCDSTQCIKIHFALLSVNEHCLLCFEKWQNRCLLEWVESKYTTKIPIWEVIKSWNPKIFFRQVPSPIQPRRPP